MLDCDRIMQALITFGMLGALNLQPDHLLRPGRKFSAPNMPRVAITAC